MNEELPSHRYNRMANPELADAVAYLAKILGAGRNIERLNTVALLTVVSCRLKGYPQYGVNTKKGTDQ